MVLGTLVLQGLTLKTLMALLGIERDDAVEREVRLARLEALRAGAAALGDDAFHKIEEELDRTELSAEVMDPGD